MRGFFLGALLVFGLCVSDPTSANADKKPPVSDESAPKPTRLLFVGNSHTFVGNMPTMVSRLADAAGTPVSVRAIVQGGQPLKKLAPRAVKAISGAELDFVVIQEQSFEPIAYFDDYSRAYKKIARTARAAGAKVVSYAVFARPAGHKHYKSFNDRGPKWMTTELFAAAKKVAEPGDRIAPVGHAWQQAIGIGATDLFRPNDYHASETGAYLTASVLYATMFEKSPEPLRYRPASIGESYAKSLRAVAWQAVQFNR